MRIEDLTAEQIERAQACKNYEEFMGFAEEVGLEFDEEAFSEEELKAISGGVDNSGWWAAIVPLIHPGNVLEQTRKIHDKYSMLY